MTRPRPAPLRPLGVAEILDGAVRLVRGNVRAVLSVSIPFAIVRTVLVGLVLLSTYSAHDSTVAVALVAELFVSALFGTLLTGLLAPLFSSDLLGERVGSRAALARIGRRSTVALVLLAAVVAVAETVGASVLFVGGAWLWGIWAVAAPALVLERIGVGAALGRSFRLVKDAFWRTWGIRTLRWVLTSILTIFIALPFELLADYVTNTDVLDQTGTSVNSAALFVVLLGIGRLLAVAITAPISAAVDVLLYTDLRMRREGMDIVLGLPPEVSATERPAVSAW